MSSAPSSIPHVGASTQTFDTSGRALVLGGGGSAGNAWLLGVVVGLGEAGLDVTRADLVIGTSAGSTAAAQITSARPADLLGDILNAPPRLRAGTDAPVGATRRNPPPRPAADHLDRTAAIIAAADNPADMRRRMGAAALDLAALDRAADGSVQERWRATVAARLPAQDWPDHPLRVVAVDASTGDTVLFDRNSGVELADAVAASCSSGPAYAIGDERYIDGGYRRSSENADLALGYRRVLVLSPLGGRTRMPLEWGMQLAVQVDELRASGSSVETVLPDRASLEAFGGNLMDPSTRVPAARAGRDQGRALGGGLTAFWG